ncbi:hypothetical protein Pth03_17030 [Planotetraspora thailandica]|uniref:RDD domain-containing protein n=1 Tax=Planotetraspora thailandica TaxID=487172 RepID=A0A8J3XUI6_9ACTN|nr:RDD family protein [Planotetraspora thailandica]GII53314.1 hypothetical protein Pth03_17030 [Planotetraspora thailandica]
MSEVVTGEAVILEVRVAQLPSRAVAFIIDWIVQTIILIGIVFLVTNASAITDDALSAGLAIFFSALVLVGYPVIFETVTRGRSLGKLALGLRVVSEDGGPERFRQALFRGLAGLLELWAFTGAPALLISLLNEKGKRLGDIFAGTIVIGERGPREAPPPPMPPQLARWAASLQLSQLPDELANTARRYLLRWHQLSPAMQHQMGIQIANQVSARVSPPPPPGVPPYSYLAAVLAERRRREEVRLAQTRGPAVPYGQAPGMPQVSPYGGTAAYGGAPVYGAANPYGQAAPSPGNPAPQGDTRTGGQARPEPQEPARPTPGGFVPPS